MDGDIYNMQYAEEFIHNRNGSKRFTCRWLPGNRNPKALIFLCHGYAIECSVTMRESAFRLAKTGYAVYGIDYEGHGRSAGLQGYIKDHEGLVNDCLDYFTSICERKENASKRRFLYGVSLGGAVALLLHRKMPTYWHGAILSAPLCRISEEMMPPEIVVNLLRIVSWVAPKWKLAPTHDIFEASYKSEQRKNKVRSNPLCYKGRPRIRTGLELLCITKAMEQNLHEVSLPFLIVHGGDDIVSDPSISKALYDMASSKDKEFKLYPGMCHGLTTGELPENTDIVLNDIIAWLNKRCTADLPQPTKKSGEFTFDVPQLWDFFAKR